MAHSAPAGAHASVTEGDILRAIQHAKKIGSTATQIYLGENSKTTLKYKYPITPKIAKDIKKELGKGMKLFVHGNLTVNLARLLEHRYRWAMDNLVYDLKWAGEIGAVGVVVHQGRQVPPLTLKESQRNMVANIVQALKETPGGPLIILENTAGEGSSINKELEEMADLYRAIPTRYRKRVAICLDTAHLHGAGYDVVEGLALGVKLFGAKHIALIHLNDSPVERGSLKDVHASIGEGTIFSNPDQFSQVVEFATRHHIPLVLETRNQSKHRHEVALIHKKQKGAGGEYDLAIDIFEKLRRIYEDLGDTHRARSYATLVKRLRAGNLSKLTPKSRAKLDEIMRTGHLELLDQLEPASELGKVIGIGPAKLRELKGKGITSLAQLRASPNEMANLTPEQALGVDYFEDFEVPLSRTQAQKYFTKIGALTGLEVVPAGSYRMGARSMKDLDALLIATPDSSTEQILEALSPLTKGVFHRGDIQLMLALKAPGDRRVRHVDLRLIPAHLLPFYLLHFGSGADFSRKIKAEAKRQGYKLSEYGLLNLSTGKYVEGLDTEEAIFAHLGLPYVPPESRR